MGVIAIDTVRMNMGIVGVSVYAICHPAAWFMAFMVVDMSLLVAIS
jgi:hypothetical protein